MTCAYCATPFVLSPYNTRKHRKFCSVRCGKKAAYRRKRPVFKARRRCTHCRARFLGKRPWTKYCSRRCGQKARDLRYATNGYRGQRLSASARKEEWLKKAYGLTLETRAQLVAQQKGACAVCKRVPHNALVVDHDHNTGKVRGMLCYTCNTKLDYFWKLRHAVSEYLGEAL